MSGHAQVFAGLISLFCLSIAAVLTRRPAPGRVRSQPPQT